MATLATAYNREPLDALVWRAIGGGPTDVEATLAANAGLADLGPLLPAGTVVAIPDPAPASTTLPLIQLWD